MQNLLKRGRRSRPTGCLALARGGGFERLRSTVRRGYTVVEVMMALSVLSIGATGIVAMQKVTLLGNTRARDLATASAIASGWIERLRADGARWTFNGTTLTTTLASTQYLSLPQGVWSRPAVGGVGMTGASSTTDVKGMDTAVVGETAFCVNIRMQTMVNNPAANCAPLPATCPSAIRAEVRVYWLRLHTALVSGGTAGANVFCSDAEIAGDLIEGAGAGRRLYHFVYMTSAILRNDT